MAERRMFAKTIIDSDAFLDMPLSTQSLYFHLSMRADDEGFVNNPKKIMRMIGASEDDLKVLISKRFILTFESGVIVIKHWKIHNYIRGDRLTETQYLEEKKQIEVKDSGAYTFRQDMLSLEEQDNKDIRKAAYKKSSLPYSFNYKIKRAFEGMNCPVCGLKMCSSFKQRAPSIQHNIPLSKGGVHEIENISVICVSCNASIQDKETDKLNNDLVVKIWDEIVELEKKNIDWFWNPTLINNLCQSNVSQMSAQDRLGKDRLGKVNNKKEQEEKTHFAEFVSMTNAEYEKLISTYGKKFADQCVVVLDNYKGSSGKKYKSDYRAILNWVIKRVKEDGFKPQEEIKEVKEIDTKDMSSEEYRKMLLGGKDK